jgi:hypothetical protein
VFGVAVLSTIFSQSGALSSAQAFIDGVVPALWVAASVVALGAVSALLLPRGKVAVAAAPASAEPEPETVREPVGAPIAEPVAA